MRLPIVLVIILVTFLYLIFPLIIWLCVGKNKLGKILTYISLILFLIILFIGITCRLSYSGEYVTIKMDFSYQWFNKTIKWNLTSIGKVDFLINIFMLIPIGIAIIFLSKKSIPKTILILVLVGVISGLTLETLQFCLPVLRSVQLSDLLLNTLSVILGGIIGLVYNKIAQVKISKKSK